jgi:tRNA-splicing ligase RtcB (3'-phosphate/5'-hydroxy nucleic acid ligase)
VRVYTDGRVPVKSWASQVEDGTLEQARNLANLPFAISHVALMPDTHQGFGMPIGGVLFTDKAVVPYAVGVDIGCSVTLIDFGVTREQLDAETLQKIVAQMARDIPVGNGPRGAHEIARPPIYGPTLEFATDAARKASIEGEVQLGTLGGGNHFVEIQYDDEAPFGISVMLHSGSRSVGKKICDYHYRVARDLCARWHVALPDPELAFLPWETPEARAYWSDMEAAMKWAEENHRRMAAKVTGAFARYLPAVTGEVVASVHHNYAAWESHHGRNGIVHRKGAVRAREGEMVLIPGSMGTASYVGLGLGSEASFQTCQHGAGRAMSRHEAARRWDEQALAGIMAEAGVLMAGEAKGATDEAPGAYKLIETVMADSADLVKPARRLRPLAVLKG